ncbi:MAG: esterase [bacterium]|nr:esterase [bacterium]
MAHLITTLGPKSDDELSAILPHEHIFVDLRAGPQDLSRIHSYEVVGLMAPEIGKLKKLGVSALVECTPVGCGRRVDFVSAVSEATGFPIVVPTGMYREPWIPEWAHMADEETLRDWMIGELRGKIKRSSVQAGWIKLSAGDDGLTECEKKILRAAAQAGAATNAAIGSHTMKGRVVREQLDILEGAGYTPDRFIWIHTQNEPDLALHLEIARRGAWIEYDAIGSDNFPDEFFLACIQDALDAGFGDRILLSHDRGWYDPAKADGGTPQPFTYIHEVFLDRLRVDGIDESTIAQMTQTNPFQAFAR